MAGWLGILTGIVWILALIWAYTRAGAGRRLDGGIMQKLSDLEGRLALVEGREMVAQGGSS